MERIDKATLRHWLEDPEVIILDVRGSQAWEASRAKIPHARYFNPLQPVETWARDLPRGKKVVLY